MIKLFTLIDKGLADAVFERDIVPNFDVLMAFLLMKFPDARHRDLPKLCIFGIICPGDPQLVSPIVGCLAFRSRQSDKTVGGSYLSLFQGPAEAERFEIRVTDPHSASIGPEYRYRNGCINNRNGYRG
jgi:hypothetical protein